MFARGVQKQEERYLCCGISHVFQGLRGHFVDVTLHSAMPRRYLLIFFFFQKYYFSMLSKSSAMLLISKDSLGTSLIPILVRHNLLDYAVFN